MQARCPRHNYNVIKSKSRFLDTNLVCSFFSYNLVITMKCLVIISLVLNTFLLKINAQDSLIQLYPQQYNGSEFIPVNFKSQTLNAFFSKNSSLKNKKPVKADENGFLIDLNVHNISKYHENEKLKYSSEILEYETRSDPDCYSPKKYKDISKLKNENLTSNNMVIDTNDQNKVSNEKINSNVLGPKPYTTDNKHAHVSTDELDSVNVCTSYHCNDTSLEDNISTVTSEKFNEEQSPFSLNGVLPQKETKVDRRKYPRISEYNENNSEGSYLRRQEIVLSDVKPLNKKTDEELPQNGNQSSIYDAQSTGETIKHEKRFSNNQRKKIKLRKLGNREHVTHHRNESIPNNNNHEINISQVQQDKRMVSEAFIYQHQGKFTNHHHDSEPLHENAQGYYRRQSSRDNGKPLFQPHTGAEIPIALSKHDAQTKHNIGSATSSPYIQNQNKYGPVTFKHEINYGTAQEHTKLPREGGTITLTKEIPMPYLVKIEKTVPYPVYVKIPYNKPYPVYLPKPYKIIHEVLQLYDVNIKVPKPYEVIKYFPKPVKVPMDRPQAVEVSKPYHVTVEKKVSVNVEKPVPYPVHVPVNKSYPVHVPIRKYYVPYKVPGHVEVPVDNPHSVYIPKTYAVQVTKPVYHTAEKYEPYPLKVRVKYPVKAPAPFQVSKEIPVYEHKQEHHY